MKKRILSLTLILVLLLGCGCQKQTAKNGPAPEEFYNYEVTHESFEEMKILHSATDFYGFSSEQELFDKVDLVFIGMPLDTFTECETRYYNLDETSEVTKDDKYFASYTIRNVKVVEVLKGDCNINDTIKIAERGTVQEADNGDSIISGVPQEYKIAKKNAKYLYYVSYDRYHDFYMAHMDNGKINIDNLDINSNILIDSSRLNEVKTHFAAEFEKYDRSSELAAK